MKNVDKLDKLYERIVLKERTGHNLSGRHKGLENMKFRVVDKGNGFDFIATGFDDWVLGLNDRERDQALKLNVGQTMKVIGDGAPGDYFTITRKESLKEMNYDQAKKLWNGDTTAGSRYHYWRQKGDSHEDAVIKAVKKI